MACDFKNDLMLVSRLYPKRGQYTSVERFLQFFPDSRKVTSSCLRPFPYRFWKSLANRVDSPAYNNWSAFLEFKAIMAIMLHRPKFVHFMYGDYDLYYTLKLKRYYKLKISATLFFSARELREKTRNKDHWRHIDLLFYTGEEQKEYLKTFIPEEKLHFLPLGVDTGFFQPAPSRPGEGSLPNILQVGLNRRDFNLAGQVLRMLKQKIPSLTADMAGCWKVKPQFENDGWIKFHPFLDDEGLRGLYQKATLLLLPLEDGGSSNSFNEAMACGLPIVTNSVPNLVDYAGSSGIMLCDRDKPDKMVEECMKLCSNLQFRDECGAAARRHALKFGWERIKERMLESYNIQYA